MNPLYEVSPEDLASYTAWADKLPPAAREVALRLRPNTCYRSTENPGHYVIYSVSNEGTVKLIHGADSYMPGFSVFGVDPQTLTECDCKLWELPTEAQQRIAKIRAENIARQRGGRVPECGDPFCVSCGAPERDVTRKPH